MKAVKGKGVYGPGSGPCLQAWSPRVREERGEAIQLLAPASPMSIPDTGACSRHASAMGVGYVSTGHRITLAKHTLTECAWASEGRGVGFRYL
eukprot:268719-Rhodomonas_salina.6